MKKGFFKLSGIVMILLVIGLMYFASNSQQSLSIFTERDSIYLQGGVPQNVNIGLSTEGELAGTLKVRLEAIEDVVRVFSDVNYCPYGGWRDCAVWCRNNGYRDSAIDLTGNSRQCYRYNPTQASDITVKLGGQVIGDQDTEPVIVTDDIALLVNQYCNFGQFTSQCEVPITVESKTSGTVMISVTSESCSAFDKNTECPVIFLDRDLDGFTDDIDRCVNEKETINGYQDQDGCPDEVPNLCGNNKCNLQFPYNENYYSCPLDCSSDIVDKRIDGNFEPTNQNQDEKPSIIESLILKIKNILNRITL